MPASSSPPATTLDDAWDAVRRDSVFTIHTPVSAGNERFAADLVRRVAGPLLDGDGRPQTGGVPIDEVLELGLGSEGDRSEFDMTGFSLPADATTPMPSASSTPRRPTRRGAASRRTRSSGSRTASTSRRGSGHAMRRDARPASSAPISTTSTRRASVGPFWERLDRLPTAELWETHQREKLELAIFARRRLRNQFARHGEAPAFLDALESALDPDILTIGFARRFATYKRAGLLFTRPRSARQLLWNAEAAGPDRLRRQGPSRPTGPASR